MHKAILSIIATIMLCISFLPTVSIARGLAGFGHNHSGIEGRHERLLGRLTKVLNLTDEQQVSIETLIETFREQSSGLRESIQQNRQTLRTLSEAVPVDTNTIQQVANDQGDLLAELIVLKTEKRIALRSVLTSDQIETLEELHDAIADRRNGDNEVEEELES